MDFPAIAKSRLDAECNNAIEQVRRAQRQKEISNEYAKENLRSSKVWLWVIFAAFVLFLGPLGAVLAFLLRNVIKKIIGLDEKVQQVKQIDVIWYEQGKLEEEIKKIKREYEVRFSEYVKLFEKKAQDLSVNYAESAVAVDVIDWITAGFCKTIDSADRRAHIQEISVPFQFKTYRNKITCQRGTYDFEIKRRAELETPLEQTALSRAIASAIQLNITMQYPQDVSGTEVVTNIEYFYGDDYVGVTIDYKAKNGNYRGVQEWNERG